MIRLFCWAAVLVAIVVACANPPARNDGSIPRRGNVEYMQEFRMPDGVRCYVYGSVGVSCLLMPE